MIIGINRSFIIDKRVVFSYVKGMWRLPRNPSWAARLGRRRGRLVPTAIVPLDELEQALKRPVPSPPPLEVGNDRDEHSPVVGAAAQVGSVTGAERVRERDDRERAVETALPGIRERAGG
jgi:hypothetical protein